LQLEEPVIKDFIRIVREEQIGDIVDVDYSNMRPFLLKPRREKINVDKRIYKKKIESTQKKVISHVSELTIYLNDECYQQCVECQQFFKQGVWCRKNNFAKKKNQNLLNKNVISNLFKDMKGWGINCVNITGGNVLLYPYLEEMLYLIRGIPSAKRICVHYMNIEGNEKKLEIIKSANCSIHLLVHFPLQLERLKKTMTLLSKSGIPFQPRVFIKSDGEYLLMQKIFAGIDTMPPCFLPFYDGNNLAFFQENIFVGLEDIEEKKPTKKLIEGNNNINMDNYGKLTILQDGAVRANIWDPPLGYLDKGSIYDYVHKELCEGRSWYRLRKNVTPCRGCLFKLLCPPLSNYNRAIGKNNLCHIWTKSSGV